MRATRFPLSGIVALVLAAGGLAPSPALADRQFFCGKDIPGAVECYVYAVSYAYRMCHQVQTIAVIEYGIEESNQGTNGKKYEFCVDKQKRLIREPYRDALQQVRHDRTLTALVQALHTEWERSLAALPPSPGEQVDSYNIRIVNPYLTLAESGAELQQAVYTVTVEVAPSRSEKPKPAARTGNGKPR
jgi:hypothetical protein